MLIQGVSLFTQNPGEILQRLEKLPSGFTARTLPILKPLYEKKGDGYRYHVMGSQAYRMWTNSKGSLHLAMAIQAFRQAAAENLREQDLPARAAALSDCGLACKQAGRTEEAMAAYEQAIQYYQKSIDSMELYRNLGMLYEIVVDCLRDKKNVGLTEDANRLRERLGLLRGLSAEVQARARGERVNLEAHRIEQGEIGLSADEPIGTDNVQDCVCVMLHDPESKKTGLAHIDSCLSIGSLQLLWDRVLAGKTPSAPLQVRFVGARYGNDSYLAIDQWRETSRQNLIQATRFFMDKPVDVLSAAIFDIDQPSAVVVQPRTFGIAEEVPGVFNFNKYISNGRPFIADRGRPLQLTFDLTVSRERAPILFLRQDVLTLKERYGEKDDDEIYRWFQENAWFGVSQIPVMLEQVIFMQQAFEKAAGQIVRRLDAKVAALARSGVEVSRNDRDLAARLISEGAIHVGHGAEKANQPLVHFIERELFAVQSGGQGPSYVVDWSGLSNFKFLDQPYETMEAAWKTTIKPQTETNSASADSRLTGSVNRSDRPGAKPDGQKDVFAVHL